MDRIVRKILGVSLAAIVILGVLPKTAISAYAADADGLWYVGYEDGAGSRYSGSKGNGTISVDSKTYYKDSRYSIKIDNSSDYNFAFVDKKITLEANTTYKFSAMVKYSGYKLDPSAQIKSTGAYLQVCAFRGESFIIEAESTETTASDWTEISCTLTTGSEKKDYYIRISNGKYSTGRCKGTAWFSDIKLEKAELTNDWNVLVITLTNIDANVDLNGKTTAVKSSGKGKTNYKASIDKAGVKDVRSITENLKTSMKTMSGGLVNVKNIDYFTSSTTLKESDMKEYSYYNAKYEKSSTIGYQLDLNSSRISKLLDKQIENNNYNQIILVSPLYGITGGWIGIGGSTYNGVHICQIAYSADYYKTVTSFRESAVVHEILHGVNADSNKYNADTPNLHENVADYKKYYSEEDEWYKYYSDYMTCNLPDGKGLDPRAFYRLSGEYTLVDSDMSSGGEVVQSSDFPINISNASVAAIADQQYTGKARKPAITVTDGTYTLKRGTDYIVQYKNNTEVGTATAVIKGKGIYTGTVTKEFKIEKAPVTGEPPTINISRKNDTITVTWSKVEGASEYYLWVSRNGKPYEQLKEISPSKTGYSIKVNSNTTYKFALTAYIPELNKYTSYVYTDKV
jgi:hypothetical protein